MSNVLTMVLAGGTGRRLMPLTRVRAKPAVPFGGGFRIIDFVLSNCVHSGLLQVKVLTQYKSDSLTRHLQRGWTLSSLVGHYVDPVPAQQRTGEHWYLGSADAVYQNLNLVEDEVPDVLVVLAADHVYRMDYAQMLHVHEESGADMTVAAIPLPLDRVAGQFGVVTVDEAGRVIGFEEKPEKPREIPGRPGYALCSMGNYVFRTEAAISAVCEDAAAGEASSHDIGTDLMTKLHERLRVHVYDFSNNRVPGVTDRERGYWRDVGGLDSYYSASMDLVAVDPIFNLYNRAWPILSAQRSLPPAKFVFSDEHRRGYATDSLVCDGCIISGGHVHHSIVGPGTRVHSHATVEEAIVFAGVDVGPGARVRRAIIDRGVAIPAGAQIGFDPVADGERFHVSKSGVVVVTRKDSVD